MRAAFLALALIAAPACASSQTTIITSPVGNDGWIIPSAGGTTLYGATDTTDNYGIAQWDNPSDLPSFTAIGACALGSNCIQAASPNITATFFTGSDSNRWIDFTTTGVGVACGVEMDSFHPAMGPTYPNYPSATVGVANLGAISHLYASFKVQAVAFSTIDQNCSPFQDAIFMAITLSDAVASPQQTFFYQLKMYKWPTPAIAAWFSNTNPFGYGDIMSSYGQSPLTVGVVTDFTGANELDLLPRLKTLITTASNGMDTNINNWTTTGIYHGHATWGDTTAESQFCCFQLIATSKQYPRLDRW